MAIHLRELATDQAVRALASRLGVSLTEAIRISAVNELARMAGRSDTLAARVGRIQKRVAGFGSTGAAADKAFFDNLSGDL